MAKLGDLSINIDIDISEESAIRCCQLLALYLSNHPEKDIFVTDYSYDGKTERSVTIGDKTHD